jgi:hypothetical protein
MKHLIKVYHTELTPKCYEVIKTLNLIQLRFNSLSILKTPGDYVQFKLNTACQIKPENLSRFKPHRRGYFRRRISIFIRGWEVVTISLLDRYNIFT